VLLLAGMVTGSERHLLAADACFTVKEGANGKNYGSIVISKAQGLQKCCELS